MMWNDRDKRENKEWEALEQIKRIVKENDYFRFCNIWRLKELGLMFIKEESQNA